MYKYLLLVLILALLVILLGCREKFGQEYEALRDTEFYGLNMFGLSQEDYWPMNSAQECAAKCAAQNVYTGNDGNGYDYDVPKCAAYSFYEPGQRCLLFESGNFIPNRPGYVSGRMPGRPLEPGGY